MRTYQRRRTRRRSARSRRLDDANHEEVVSTAIYVSSYCYIHRYICVIIMLYKCQDPLRIFHDKRLPYGDWTPCFGGRYPTEHRATYSNIPAIRSRSNVLSGLIPRKANFTEFYEHASYIWAIFRF